MAALAGFGSFNNNYYRRKEITDHVNQMNIVKGSCIYDDFCRIKMACCYLILCIGGRINIRKWVIVSSCMFPGYSEIKPMGF